MQTLSYGYKQPEDGDKGDIFFPALSDNITRLNGHTHDGSDSAFITIASLTATVASLSNTAWDVVNTSEDGTFYQTVSMPTGISFSACDLSFQSSAGDPLLLSVDRVSASSYTVYINDSSADLTVLYGQ